jgi:hypothetical protein
VKNKGANFKTFTIALTKIVLCIPFMIIMFYFATCYALQEKVVFITLKVIVHDAYVI